MFAKQLVAATLAVFVTLGLAACDPPMPPELLASRAEQSVTCVDGDLNVATPIALQEVVASWSSSVLGDCPAMNLISVDGYDETAAAVLSMDGQVPPFCKAFSSFPVAVDAGVVAYALLDAPTLNLTPQNVQDIFSGKIKNWSDPAIAASNPDVVFPNLAINVVGTPMKASIDALAGWFGDFEVVFSPSLAKISDIDDGAALSTMAEGDIAITSYSNALYAFSTVAAITVGPDAYVDSSIADAYGVQRGNDSVIAKPEEGEAPAYEATYPVMMHLCGEDNPLARAIGRYIVRKDSQGSLGSAVVAPLADSVRLASIAEVEKGLAKPSN